MHLEASDADLHQAIDFGAGVGDVLRMNRAEGNQPLWLGGAVARNPVVNLRRKADDVRTDVIDQDRKSTRLNSSHGYISYAVFCLKKKNYRPRSASTRTRLISSVDTGHTSNS